MKIKHYKNPETLYKTLSYIGVVAINLGAFFVQRETPPELHILFISFFVLMIVTVNELFDTQLTIFASGIAIFLQSLSTNFLLAMLYIVLTGYYFLIRYLRKKRVKDAVEGERHFRSIVNVSLQPITIKNHRGEVLFASQSIQKLLGLTKKFPVGKSLEEYIHPQDIPTYNSFLTMLLSQPNERFSAEIRLKKHGGEYIWARADAINLLSHPDIKAIVTNWQDITSQKTNDYEQSQLLKNERDARALAEKAVRDRDEFLSIASHELKTPLTSVLLQLQATLRKILTQSLADFSGRDLLDSLQIAEKQSLSLSTLIKDLLNVSLASTGRLTLNKEEVYLPALIESITKKYSEEIKISGCSVSLTNKKLNIIGKWDPVRLEQAITNLLMNALKYAKGKHISITTDADDSYAYLSIADNGSGIPSDMLTKVFEPFQRATSNSNIKGLGVGLFITRQIVTSHDGTIEVESKLGKGTTFTIKLPLKHS